MRARWTSTLGALLAVALGVAACRHDSATQPHQPASLSRDEGVFLLRLVAGLESQANGGAKPYRVHSLADIVRMTDAAPLRKVAMIDSESGLYKGYVLRVWIQDPPYAVSLAPEKPGCDLAFFYEGEVIYPAYAFGCDAQRTAAPATAPPETLPREQAVRVMRDASTTEIAMAAQGRSFGNLSEVFGSPAWTDPGYRVRRADLPVHAIDSISAEILGDTFRIITSNDRKHFRASLIPTQPVCGNGFFIDDGLVGYVGMGLGC